MELISRNQLKKLNFLEITKKPLVLSVGIFLKEGNPEGLPYEIPLELLSITDISQLFLMSAGAFHDRSRLELSLWAGVVLKVMHTILHVDKDLRQNYFNHIQTQIFDRFYKYIHRDGQKLYIQSANKEQRVDLHEFQTKSKKTRESVVIKLLHKKENVAEELFDRIGIRFITKTKFDCLKLIKFLVENYLVLPHNVKPSRSHNSLIDLKMFKKKFFEAYKKVRKEGLDTKEADALYEEITIECLAKKAEKQSNEHTLKNYRAIHFTCRQLIKYTNPFFTQFNKLKNEAKNNPKDEFAKKILALDSSTVTKNLRFFYPFEIQITDIDSHQKNTAGEASHKEYKSAQVLSAMNRIFKPIISYYETHPQRSRS